MRRRRLFTAVSGLSLLLCAAVVVLWVRSYRVTDELRCDYSHVRGSNGVDAWCRLQSHRGRLYAWHQWHSAPIYLGDAESRAAFEKKFALSTPLPSTIEEYERLLREDNGLTLKHHEDGYYSRRWHEDLPNVPHWLVATAAAFPPLLWLGGRWRRRRRRDNRLCAACGYELRATPGRCPECGTSAAAIGA